MKIENRRAVSTALTAGLAFALAIGCARTSVQGVQVMASDLPRPSMIVVYPFVTSGATVALNSGLLSRALAAVQATPEEQEREKVAQQVTEILTQKLVKRIQDLGMPAQPSSAVMPAQGSILAIEGHILSIDEGNPTRRMLIGLGAGASEVRTLVQVYAVTGGSRRLVEDFYTTVKSSRKPGMAETMGMGAAAGRAAESAAVSVGVTALTAQSQTVEGDAEAAAKAIAKQLAKFFAQQGWIALGQGE
jgi:hypothetical protein